MLAAVIMSPLRVTQDVFWPSRFLKGLRRCDHYGVLLIFDEVMTGFRLARGGAAELMGFSRI